MARERLKMRETSKDQDEGIEGNSAGADRRKVRKDVKFKEGKEGRKICCNSAK